MKRFAYGFATTLLTLVAVAPVTAQTIHREGDGDVFIDDRIDRLLRRGNYVAIHEETRTIGAGETIPDHLLVLGGELYLEGTVDGDLVAVDADVYLRPGSRVEGDIVNIGGGLYRSEQAIAGGRIRSLPNLPYTVHEEGDRLVIVSHEEHKALDLDGFFGFRVPEYNRVDGFAPKIGATYTARPLVAGFAPGVRAVVGYNTEPGEFMGGGSAFLERGGFAVEGGWIRETRSEDRWIRADLRNSFDFLYDGDDLRNYYGADVAWGEVRQLFGNEDIERYVMVGLRYEDEDARSLRHHNPFTAFDDDTTLANPAIQPGTIRSFIPFVESEWLTARTATDARVEVEVASYDVGDGGSICIPFEPCSPEEGDFTRLRIDSEFAMQALSDHTLEIELQFMVPLAGDDPLPRQRWGILGGSNTIRTLSDGEFYGDHLAYSETEYQIPLRFIRLPRNVVPNFELLHSAGLAWTGDRDDGEDFVQNIGARLNVWAGFARWIYDPASGVDELTFGLSWPFDETYPWQQAN